MGLRVEVFEERERWGWAVVSGTLVLKAGYADDASMAILQAGAALVTVLADRLPDPEAATLPPPRHSPFPAEFAGSGEITAEHISVDIPVLDPDPDTDPWGEGGGG